MSYKYSTGSVFRGDIYYEDDRLGARTYIDFGHDTITLRPSGSAILYTEATKVGINTTSPEAYLDIKNTTDDGATNRTMIRLHNYRADDADENDWAPTSLDFVIENVEGGVKGATARIAAVIAPEGTDHNSPEGERSSALIFSTMNDDTLSEGARINNLGYLGIGTDEPVTPLDTHFNSMAMDNDTGGGWVVKFGSGTLTTGKLYYLHTDGTWTATDADAATTGGDQLLGIALGTAPGTHGVLLRGFFDAHTYLDTHTSGKAVYISVTAGEMTITAPSATGDIIRIIGYCTSQSKVIYFNPSSTFVELS